VEGLTVTANGLALIVTDNDGVDTASSVTQFLHLGAIFKLCPARRVARRIAAIATRGSGTHNTT
jgi:hypothetical protein